LEDLNTVIKDLEGGFDVFIMNGDKKIGEISFTEEDKPNQYTISDATIDDEYKGNRIYPKTIINLFKEKPNIIINSVFRSPEAQKAWIYLLSNLPPNIGKSVKYYKDEDTTLFQLKSRNLQESIKRILREETNKKVFDHNYEDLLDNISSKDTGISWVEPEDLLNDKIKTLKRISKKSEIKLYRLVYSKSKTDINTKKIGHHFVGELDYFHEQMIDYLYYNAKKENKKLQKDDLWVIEIKTPTNNIDYHETILTFSLHPNEDEITIIDDKKVKIVNIFKY
jgi:hypothetical protein